MHRRTGLAIHAAELGGLRNDLGQSLAALHADAAWLQRAVALDAQARAVLEGMVDLIAQMQQRVRQLPQTPLSFDPRAGNGG